MATMQQKDFQRNFRIHCELMRDNGTGGQPAIGIRREHFSLDDCFGNLDATEFMPAGGMHRHQFRLLLGGSKLETVP